MDLCVNYSRLALGTKPGADARLVRLRCKQWTCPYCAEINKRQWLKRIIEGVKVLQGYWQFWTLTHDKDGLTYTEQRKHLSACFNRLNTRIKRAHGINPAYVRVVEIGKAGTQRMHHHVLWNFYHAPTYTLWHKDGKEYSTAIGALEHVLAARYGRIHDVSSVTERVRDRPIQEQAVYTASYVSKYMAKQDATLAYPKYTRRFSVSRNWPVLDHEEGYGESDMEWQVVPVLTKEKAMTVYLQRQHIVDTQTGDRITLEQFNRDGAWVDPVIHPDWVDD